jgi:hypothetical protein
MKSMMKIATTACLGVHGAQGLMLKRSKVAVMRAPMEQVSVEDAHAGAVATLQSMFEENFSRKQIQVALEQCNWNAEATIPGVLMTISSLH